MASGANVFRTFATISRCFAHSGSGMGDRGIYWHLVPPARVPQCQALLPTNALPATLPPPAHTTLNQFLVSYELQRFGGGNARTCEA